MKESKKREISVEQKIYTVLIGAGICALAAVTFFYGVRNLNSDNPARQQIQLGEDNPVSAPVARTEEEEKADEEETTEKENKTTEKNKETREVNTEDRDNKTTVSVYNGQDKLPWPVTGNVIIPYSMDTTVYFETLDQYQCNPAIYIKAEKGTDVKAVYGGNVTNVQKNDRYGNMIIVDIGNGYKTFYGQLENVTLKKGDTVKTGDVIGKIAEPTDYFTLEGSHLYFKMTFKGKEINPTEYLES